MTCRCCSPCYTNQGNYQFDAPCCTCVPKRICVSIYPPEALSQYCLCSDPPHDDPYGPMARLTLHLDCTANRLSYSGSFLCGKPGSETKSIDLKFTFERIPRIRDGQCYFILASTALGYTFTNELGEDKRLKVRMGGAYNDREVMHDECVNGGPFEFVADFSAAVDGCGIARIVVNAADFVARETIVPEPYPVNPACVCDCIIMSLVLDGTATAVRACWDPYVQLWHGRFKVDEVDHDFYVRRDSAEGDPTVLSMTSNLGDGAAVSAECDCKSLMYASWDLDSYGGKFSVWCDIHTGCVDCKCHCRCMCVIYSDGVNAGVSHVCIDEYDNSWTARFDFYGQDPIELSARLICDPHTGITKMHLGGFEGGIAEPQSVACPDIAAAWSFDNYDGSTTTIVFTCDNCGHCNSGLMQTPCCPVPVPLIIYATIIGTITCFHAEPPPITETSSCPTVTIPLVYNPNPSGLPYWGGEGVLDCPGMENSCNSDDRDIPSVWKITIRVDCGNLIDTVIVQCVGPNHWFPFIIQPVNSPYNTCDPVYSQADLLSFVPTNECVVTGGAAGVRSYSFSIVVTE